MGANDFALAPDSLVGEAVIVDFKNYQPLPHCFCLDFLFSIWTTDHSLY